MSTYHWYWGVEEEPSNSDLQLSPFEQAQRQIAEEERHLRRQAEAQLRAYASLIADYASFFLAAELDRRLRVEPRFVMHATPTAWRELLDDVRQQRLSERWGGHDDAPGEDRRPQMADAERWQQEAQRLEAENHLLRNLLSETGRAALETRHRDTVVEAQPPASNVIRLPDMPAQPPKRFLSRFTNWPRASVILAALAQTGWAMRQAIAELLAERDGQVKAHAGSLRRAFENIVREGFVEESKVVVEGLHKPETESTTTTVVLIRLSADGQAVLRECGVEPVASEWEVLLRRDGASQSMHTALVCVAAYHARLRGCATAVCPPVAGDAQPDLAVTTGAQTVYVEVSAESKAAGPRMTKWRNQVALQGRVALVAVTPEMRARLVVEAQTAGAAHGLATDLQTLFDTQEARGPLWGEEW